VRLLAIVGRSTRGQGSGYGAFATWCLGVVLVGACSSDPVAPPRPTPSTTLRLSASTSGPDADADGYLVSLDRQPTQLRLTSNGSVTFSGLTTGVHLIDVFDVAPNCAADVRSMVVTIPSGGVATDTTLHVTCEALGEVRVTVTTGGVNPDLNGYQVMVSGIDPLDRTVTTLPPNDQAVLRVAPGRHVVALRDVAANCDGVLGPRDIDVVSGGSVSLTFTVTCEAATRIAYSAFFTEANAEIYTVLSDASGSVRVTDHPAKDVDPAWSPDGSRIAFASNRDGLMAIFVMNDDGSDVKRLTSPTSSSHSPAWSPDGREIAFASAREGNADIYVMNADGTDVRRLTSDASADLDPAWSPDGSRIAFSTERNKNAEIYVMSRDGSNVSRLTANNTWDGQPAWSPDGTRIAFAQTRCDLNRYPDYCYQAVMVLGESGRPEEVGIGEEPTWSPNGRAIATTGFTCELSYYYGPLACTVAGIGILVPFPNGQPGSREAWNRTLTAGAHHSPSWRR